MKRYFTLLSVIICVSLIIPVHAQIINTFAGTGAAGYNGDGIPCTTSTLDTPYCVAVDRAHNVYIGDAFNDRIRKVNSSGIISTIAGTGIAGYSGDNGLATLAKINKPFGIFVDDAGNVYFADAGNARVRKIDTSGIITTVAGNGISGYFGDNGLATVAQLNGPSDVFVDSLSNIYISEYTGNRIRKVNSTGIITTIGGNGVAGYNGDNIAATSAQLNAPHGITKDNFGNIYVADTYNQRLRKIDKFGMITTIAGNGVGGYNGDRIFATTASLYGPVSVKTDRKGNIYISEDAGSRIRRINSIGVITTIAGNGSLAFGGDGAAAIDAQFFNIEGIAIDDSVNMYIADASNNRIRYIGRVLNVDNISYEAPAITIVPNPNKGFFTVNISSTASQPVSLVITNMLGQNIKECEWSTNKPLEINITSPAGVYFISAITAAGKIAGKMIIQ